MLEAFASTSRQLVGTVCDKTGKGARASHYILASRGPPFHIVASGLLKLFCDLYAPQCRLISPVCQRAAVSWKNQGR
jgi:hypothetical protein